MFSTYNNQMLLDAVGNIPLTANYVFHTFYDEAGRARLRQLGRNGSNPVLQSQYTYYGWTTQGGRLQQLTAGLPGTPTSLIDFNYSYSTVGNVLSILDNKMGPQTQSFGYDALNRLTSASATGGSQGNYGTDNYSYDTATGNLLTKAGITYTYADANHKHAVTSQSNGNSYQYDSNGNMTRRVISGQTYTLGYDAENRLSQVTGAAAASFGYDGDGNRVTATEGVTTTIYVGNYFEWTTSTANMVRYYYAGSTRVAMKKGSGQVKWLLGDHLGSASAVANYDGSSYSPTPQRYKAWGETRTGGSPTPYQFTGQFNQISIGLYFYGARYYDPYLSRWIQPDSIVSDLNKTTDIDRYAYVRNNPVLYKDPNGHKPHCPDYIGCAPGLYFSEATVEALDLVGDWATGMDEENQVFGPDDPLTVEVKNDEGMDKFRQKWAESGYEDGFTYNETSDERKVGSLPVRLANGAVVYVREHVVELGGSILGFGSRTPEGHVDAVGGTIGSLDRIHVTYIGNGMYKIEVSNTMSRESGSRIPGTDLSYLRNWRRPWPTGNIYQLFWWYEQFPTGQEKKGR